MKTDKETDRPAKIEPKGSAQPDNGQAQAQAISRQLQFPAGLIVQMGPWLWAL